MRFWKSNILFVVVESDFKLLAFIYKQLRHESLLAVGEGKASGAEEGEAGTEELGSPETGVGVTSFPDHLGQDSF